MYIDSLKQVIQSDAHDTIKFHALQSWDIMIYYYNDSLNAKLLAQMDSMCDANLSRPLDDTLQNYFLRSKAWTHIALGLMHKESGNYTEAIKSYTLSLKISEQQDDSFNKSTALFNIAIIYKEQDEPDKAQSYFRDAYQLAEENQDTSFMSSSANYIGITFADKAEYDSALVYLKHAKKLAVISGDNRSIAHADNTLGWIYKMKEDFPKASDYTKAALDLFIEINDPYGTSMTSNNLADVYFRKGDLSQSRKYSLKALEIAKQENYPLMMQRIYESLWRTNKNLGNYEQSLFYHESFIDIRDSLKSEANQKEIIRQEYKLDYEIKAAADSVKAAEEARIQEALLTAERAETDRQKQQTYYLYGLLALALLSGGFVYNRFMLTRKQKGIIEEQKIQVDAAFLSLEEKNKEIVDSTNYAKRIQSAILPPDRLIKQHLTDSFVLYKPKDIVAGDFYWLEATKDKVFFAACDCTGHGVPGAMVSVVCNNGLNRSVREYKANKPGEILDKTRELVITEFEKSEDEVKDGMDVALCSLTAAANGTGPSRLEYAGAHNPLWIIRKGVTEVEEIKADKQPIGRFDAPEPFTTHEIELNQGDSCYIFSDGYVDQFGGDKGKKFKSSNLKKLLLSIQSESMDRQRTLLEENFEEWKGSLEQLDDVCMIGVRV